MKKSEVVVGQTYLMNHSSGRVQVKILGTKTHRSYQGPGRSPRETTRWWATNLKTGRTIEIKSAVKLSPLPTPAQTLAAIATPTTLDTTDSLDTANNEQIKDVLFGTLRFGPTVPEPWIHTGSVNSPGTALEIHGEGGPQPQVTSGPVPVAPLTPRKYPRDIYDF